MSTAAAFNVLGLIANLAGVILLFCYGMPFRVRIGGETYYVASGAPNRNERRIAANIAKLPDLLSRPRT
jgi:hypothetical protein